MIALATAAYGAGVIARRDRTSIRRVGSALAAVLGALTLADLLHAGAHPATAGGTLVVATSSCTAVLVGLVRMPRRRRPA
jgi:hypothetical protein